MSYVMYMLMIVVVLGLVGVASNPSPIFAAFSLVMTAGGGCGILAYQGGCFLSLVLFLIYLGGMLVVFAYSVAFAADLHPEGWGTWAIFVAVLLYILGVGIAALLLVSSWEGEFWVANADFEEFEIVRGDLVNVGSLYSLGGGLLIIGAWALLLVLFVVLKLVRGSSWGAIRVVN